MRVSLLPVSHTAWRRGRLHHVKVGTGVRRLRNKTYFLKEKREAGLVDDGVAEDDGVAHVVHLGGYGQRFADGKAVVPAAQRGRHTTRIGGHSLLALPLLQALLVRRL